MEAELLKLQEQVEVSHQRPNSSLSLSEKNIAELVQILQNLHIIDYDLLRTVSGNEYITLERLRLEMCRETKKLGRVSLIDLAERIGVDLYHIERQASQIVSEDHGLMLIQGEIVSDLYWDGVAEEINDRLHECSHIALTELAAEWHVGSEFVAAMIQKRLGTIVKGRLENGRLYTSAYVSRVSAMVRGAARGTTVPTNMSVIWATLPLLLQEMDGSISITFETAFYQSVFNGMVKEGIISGLLRAGVNWTPTVFAIAQRKCVETFFSQNSFISYDMMQKLGIPQPVQYLQSRYPNGMPLMTIFVHSSVIEMLDSAVEDVIDHSSWIDSLSVLPTSFLIQDASKILLLCGSANSALKDNKACILGDSCLFSNEFIKDICNRLEKQMEFDCISGPSFNSKYDSVIGEGKGGSYDFIKFSEFSKATNAVGDNKLVMDKRTTKRRGRITGSPDGDGSSKVDNRDGRDTTSRSKKKQQKNRDTVFLKGSDPKLNSKKNAVETNVGSIPTREWVIDNIKVLVPEIEEQGTEDSEAIFESLGDHLLPLIATLWKQKQQTLLANNVEKTKHLLDNMQKKVEELFLNMQLYEKAFDCFEADPSTLTALHRHLLRTTGASIVDTILQELAMQNSLNSEVQEKLIENQKYSPLTPTDRVSIAKCLHGSLSTKAIALIETFEGKRVESFMVALGALANESGLILKRLDKKLEKSLLHSYKMDMLSQISSEKDPVSLLPKVVSLLYIKVYNRALQAPGRAISVAISRLKDKLDDSSYAVVAEYHAATVKLLALMSATATPDDDEEGCSSDRIMSRREVLEKLMPELKALVLTSSPAHIL